MYDLPSEIAPLKPVKKWWRVRGEISRKEVELTMRMEDASEAIDTAVIDISRCCNYDGAMKNMEMAKNAIAEIIEEMKQIMKEGKYVRSTK